MTVPKIIHQMWLSSDNVDVNEPPRDTYKQNKKDFLRLNPDFEYMWWNNSRVDDIFQHPDLKKYYDFYKEIYPHIAKCDFSRYAIMYKYGGMYFDLDFKFLKKIPEEFLDNHLVLCQEPSFQDSYYKENVFKSTGRKAVLCNGVVMSSPGNKFWLGLMDRVMAYYSSQGSMKIFTDVVSATGPRMVTDYVDELLSKGFQDITMISDSSLFFGYPNLSLAISYNDWNDGTGWAVRQFGEMKYGNELFIVATVIIVFVVVISLILLVIIWVNYTTKRRNHNPRYNYAMETKHRNPTK